MNQLKLSIIVAAYNLENEIVRCLKSLHNNLSKESEFLIINDGSTDNTLDEINKYLMKIKDDRFHVFNNKNMGVSETRNFGITKAKGKYIIFVDGDDYFVENSEIFTSLIQRMDQNDLEILEYNFYWEKNGKIIKKNYLDKDIIKLTDGTDFIKQANIDNKGLMPQPWKFVFNKAFIQNNGFKFQILSASEDTLWIWQLLSKAKRVERIAEVNYVYVSRENSNMHNFDYAATLKRSKSEINVANKIKNIVLNLNLSTENKKSILSTLTKSYISSIITGYANGLNVDKNEIQKFIGNIKLDVKDKVKLFIVLSLPKNLGRRIAYIIWNKRIKQL